MTREAAAGRRRSAGSFWRWRSHDASLDMVNTAALGLGIVAPGSALRRCCSTRLRQFEEIFDVRERGAIHALDFGIAGFDDVILIGGVGAVAVAESEVSGR